MASVRVENPQMPTTTTTQYLATAFPHDQDPKQSSNMQTCSALATGGRMGLTINYFHFIIG
jgi:hypothetical protein